MNKKQSSSSLAIMNELFFRENGTCTVLPFFYLIYYKKYDLINIFKKEW